MRGARLLMALVAFGLCAPQCGSGGGGGTPTATVILNPTTVDVSPGALFVVDLEILPAPYDVQAYDISIQSDPAIALPLILLPHADFDDDGNFFIAPQYSPGNVQGIIDLRHGAPVSTDAAVATLVVRAVAAGSTNIEITAQRLASPTGEDIPAKTVSALVTVTP